MINLKCHVVFALLCSLTLADRVTFGRQLLNVGQSQGAVGSSAEGDGSRCSSAIDTPHKGLVNDDLEGPGKDYSTAQMNSLISKVDPMFYNELVAPTQEYTILVPPRHILEGISVHLSHHFVDDAAVADLLYLHILPGRYELQQLQTLSERGMPILTYHKKALNLTRLDNGNVQFSLGQSSATILGQAFESCKQGSLLYSVVGTLSSDDLLPRLNGWDYRGALPTQHHSRPFVQAAGMIMMFAFVLVLTLAFVACCRGRRHLRGRSFFNGTFMPFGQKRVPDGPPPPPPPKVMYRLDVHRWSMLPLEQEPVQNENEAVEGENAEASGEGPGPLSVSGALHEEPSAEARTACLRLHGSDAESDLEADTCGLNADTACLICYEREGDHVLVPCGHGGYCQQCAHKVLTNPIATRLCPICRAGLSAIVKVSLDTPMRGQAKVLASCLAACAPRPSTSSAGAAPPRSARLPEAASSLTGPIFVSLPASQRRRSGRGRPRSRDRRIDSGQDQLSSGSVPVASTSAAAASAADAADVDMGQVQSTPALESPELDRAVATTPSAPPAAMPTHAWCEVEPTGDNQFDSAADILAVRINGFLAGASRGSGDYWSSANVSGSRGKEVGEGEKEPYDSCLLPGVPAAEKAVGYNAPVGATGHDEGKVPVSSSETHVSIPPENGEIQVKAT